MQRKIVNCLSLCLFLSSAPAWCDDLIADGIKAYRAGEYQKAEQLYKQALSQESDPAQKAAIYRNIGVLYEAQGKDASEFNKKADELDPPAKLKRVDRRDMDTVLINNKAQTQPNLKFSRDDAPPQEAAGSAKPTPPTNSPGLFANFGMNQTSVNSGFGFGASPIRGLNIGGSGSSSMNSPMFGANSPMFQSTQTADGVSGSSNATPVVLPKPDGGAVIFFAPAQNAYSSRQNPDGSSTTIIRRTE